MRYDVIKRDGRRVQFDHFKIVNAIMRSARDNQVNLDVEPIALAVENRIQDTSTIS